MTKVIFTASSINPETEQEAHGYVDLDWNRFVLHEDAEDVRTKEVPSYMTIEDFLEEELGSIDNYNGRGTYYFADGKMNYETGETFTYAAHVLDD